MSRPAPRLVTPLLARVASIALPFAWCLVPAAARGDVAQDDLIPLAQFPREPLVVETHSARRHAFDAWRADTPATHEQGLMFVREMRDGQAMIFVYDPPRYVAMWMKNTLIPLDMLFVNADGCVIKVKHDAQPQSLATIAADGPVALVVELKGGAATALGIGLGDRVRRPQAGWPTSDRACTSNP
ncbi:MAG: DUF192 domain-containing protein [Steroidobacteraceae bacterium]